MLADLNLEFADKDYKNKVEQCMKMRVQKMKKKQDREKQLWTEALEA